MALNKAKGIVLDLTDTRTNILPGVAGKDIGAAANRFRDIFLANDVNVTGNVVVGGLVDGRDVAADGIVLDAIGPALTDAQIKTKYEANLNTNAFTDADVTRLAATLLRSGGTMTGSLILAGDPSVSLEAATKQYVDNVAQGLDVKAAVRMSTAQGIGNLVLSGIQTIDGVVGVAGDRVAPVEQTDATTNGIYIMAAGAWTRSTDADSDADVTSGMSFAVTEGTLNANRQIILVTPDPITLGTTALTFSFISAAISDNSVTNLLLVDMKANSVQVRNAATLGDPSAVDELDLSTLAAPIGGFFMLGWDANGVLGKIDVGALPLTLGATDIAVTSGTMDGVVIGAVDPRAGDFTVGKFGAGTAALPSISFTADPNTGFLNTPDVIEFSAGGQSRLIMSNIGIEGKLAGSARLINVAATALIPSIVPNKGDPNSGLGSGVGDTLSLIAGGKEMLSLKETGVATTDQIIVGPAGIIGAAATPSLAFGDGDTGLFESIDDTLGFAALGVHRFSLLLNSFQGFVAASGAIFNEGATATNPTLIPRRESASTGIGSSAANVLSLVSNGVETISLSSTAINVKQPMTVAADPTVPLGVATKQLIDKQAEVVAFAVSDEETAITTGATKITFRMPFAMTLTAIRASFATAGTTASTIDVNLNGVTVMAVTKLTVDANEKTSETAAVEEVISVSALTDDGEITVDIDTAGTGAKGLKLYLIGTRT